MMGISSPLEPIPTFFMPEAFENAVDNGIPRLHATVGGMRELDLFIRNKVWHSLPDEPEELALIMYRAHPEGSLGYKHFYQLRPDEPLVAADQLGLEPGATPVVTTKAEVLALRRTILEVKVADFVGGTLSGQVVWSALSDPPEAKCSSLHQGMRQLAANWGNGLVQAATGPSEERKQKLAEKAADAYPQAVFLYPRPTWRYPIVKA
jgi:hypothetical protein